MSLVIVFFPHALTLVPEFQGLFQFVLSTTRFRRSFMRNTISCISNINSLRFFMSFSRMPSRTKRALTHLLVICSKLSFSSLNISNWYTFVAISPLLFECVQLEVEEGIRIKRFEANGFLKVVCIFKTKNPRQLSLGSNTSLGRKTRLEKSCS